MLKIYISKKFESEKRYLIEVLFKFILKVEYEISLHRSDNYLIKLPNNNEVEIIDAFFKDKNENEKYLLDTKLPNDVKFLGNKFVVDKNLPLLFGDEKLEEQNSNRQKRLIIHSDLFASAFFMLTRMEEYIDHRRDEHMRFSAAQSVASKFNFLHRPIVNEYAEMLWNVLVYLGYDERNRIKSEFKIIPTHDIDKIYYKFSINNLLGDLFLDKNIKRAFKRISLPKQNYWDTFNWLMDISERQNAKSIFYFIPDSNHKLDNRYSLKDNFIKDKFDLIKERGHVIGIHPGYETMLDEEEFARQKRLLEDTANLQIVESRQHYLRFSFPQTPRILDANGIKFDSSLGYADAIGFRCGTSCEYPLFDLQKREKLNLIERPLIIMDTILRNRKKTEASAIEAIDKVNAFKETCRKYNIPLTILFHNNSFDPIRWNGWKKVYENNFLK